MSVNETVGPVKLVGADAQQARSTAIASSIRSPRLRYSTLQASNSSRSQPAPSPRVSRPPESTSSVATCLAATTGWRSGRTSTLVPSPIRVVTAAANDSVASASSRNDGG